MIMIDVICESCGKPTIVENGICKRCGKKAVSVNLETILKDFLRDLEDK